MIPDKPQCTVFTVCNLAYLPKALVLAESVWQYSAVRLTIVIFDRRPAQMNVATEAELRFIEECGIPDFSRLAFKYDIVELSTSLKPMLALRFLETTEKVIFLDPDTCTYAPLTPILAALDAHPIVVTPHYTTPQTDHLGESDVGMMRFGSFNLGFFAVRREPETRAFLDWWSRRCLSLSFFETQFGLSTDQKWVTIAPAFFPGLHVSFDLGYNAAPWNTFERRITHAADGTRVVNGAFSLIFFHFSNFDLSDPGYLKKRSFCDRDEVRLDVLELGNEYAAALARNATPLSATRYAFDYLSGGEYLSPTLRRAYAAIEPELPPDSDPFDSAGIVAGFARRNHLFESRGAPRYVSNGFRDVKEHARTLALIYVLMRLVLRVVGPNRFYNLSRLLVYLSSYRQNRGLWKFTPPAGSPRP